jgi:RNA polymerase sigma-70 factor (ECF subfamily)
VNRWWNEDWLPTPVLPGRIGADEVETRRPEAQRLARAVAPVERAVVSSPSTPAEDAGLLRRIAARDREAFSEFYDRFAGVLFSVAVRILQNDTEAEDVLQEVLLQIWEKAGAYDGQLGKPLTWAITLTRNRAIDRLRAAQRRRVILETAVDPVAFVADPNPDSRETSIGQETAKAVRAALGQLSVAERQALELAFFGGLTQTEIAAQLNEPLGTIKARIRRGMLHLRERLEGQL